MRCLSFVSATVWAYLPSTSGCFVSETCSGDVECGSARICVEGKCEEGCRLSRDCPTGRQCIGNRCIEGADTDSDVNCEVECPDDMVPVCGYCIDVFEASRQDATEDSSGTDDSRALSRAGVLPWTLATTETARTACEASGKRLCTPTEWIKACRGPDDTDYPYGDAYEPQTCNGIDAFGRDAFRRLPTGSMPNCTNGFGVLDISGNVWEIDGDIEGWVHGGAFNCIDSATLHLCSYNLTFTLPRTNVGFRCCSDGL